MLPAVIKILAMVAALVGGFTLGKFIGDREERNDKGKPQG